MVDLSTATGIMRQSIWPALIMIFTSGSAPTMGKGRLCGLMQPAHSFRRASRPHLGAVPASDRVELTWPTGAIKNAWLEVQVLANPDTGLADLGGLYAGLGDVFYFANVVGDVRDADTSSYFVNGTDTKLTSSTGGTADVNSPYDSNKDGVVNGTDLTIVKNGGGSLAWIDVSSGGPLAPQAAAAGVSWDWPRFLSLVPRRPQRPSVRLLPWLLQAASCAPPTLDRLPAPALRSLVSLPRQSATSFRFCRKMTRWMSCSRTWACSD